MNDGKLFKGATYLLSFGLARGALFFSPIILANLLTPLNYGRLELAQAIASIAVLVLTMGTANAIPLVLVRKIKSATWQAILTHHSLAGLLLAAIALFSFLSGYSSVVWLAALVTAALMQQALWSVTFKSLGRSQASLFTDAAFWGLLALTALYASFFEMPAAERWELVVGAVVVYFVVLMISTLTQLTGTRVSVNNLKYLATLHTSYPLMIASLMGVIAVTSGRLGIGLLSTPEILADYAILYRATALPIIAHQIIIIARYRQIFELSAERLQRRLPVIVGLVFASVVLFWLLSDIAVLLLGPAFNSAFTRYPAEGLLILTQCILWSAIALNDLVNARAQIAGPVAKATAFYFSLVLPIAWWFLSSQSVTLALFVSTHSLIMGGYFLVQIVVMWHRGIKLKATWAFALTGFVAMSMIALTKQ